MNASIKAEIQEEVHTQLTEILQKLGLPGLEALLHEQVPDKSRRHENGRTSNDKTDPLLVEFEEETPCTFLMEGDTGDLSEVAYGHMQPPNKEKVAHSKPIEKGHVQVSVDSVIDGLEEFPLPIPTPSFNLNTLGDAQGSFVSWPPVWLLFEDDKILKKLRKSSPKHSKEEDKVIKANEAEVLSKEVNSFKEKDAPVEVKWNEKWCTASDKVATKEGAPKENTVTPKKEPKRSSKGSTIASDHALVDGMF